MRHLFAPVGMANIKKSRDNMSSKDVEKEECLHTVGENVNY
jgi:hypothetical protein